MTKGYYPLYQSSENTSMQSGKAGKTRAPLRCHQHKSDIIRCPERFYPMTIRQKEIIP
ncbi:MAG: hypothetical protein WB986_06900 [Methanoregula sp.]|uniref:hypothetical protein n=1 Tax=Methanoregula sp. TaxID=2052170 RepID=UPI003BB16318